MAFKKGKSKTGGRKKGSKNKVTRTVREKFLEVFNKLQDDRRSDANLLNWAKKNPKDFYPLAAKLIPTEINANIVKVGKDLEEEQYEE